MQILRAGKKPIQEWKAADIGIAAGDVAETNVEQLSNLAPVEQRKKILFEGKLDENVNSLVDALIKEGVLGG